MIAHPSKEQLADDGTGKGYRVDIALRRRICVLCLVQRFQYSVHLANNPRLPDIKSELEPRRELVWDSDPLT